jgi:hypothetical protein
LDRVCAVTQWGAKAQLGWGFFPPKGEALTFFDRVRQTLVLYRRELIEAGIASAFIGLLALATS